MIEHLGRMLLNPLVYRRSYPSVLGVVKNHKSLGIQEGEDAFAVQCQPLLDLAAPRSYRIIFTEELPSYQETGGMKCLIVYYVGGQWIGEEVSWKRSGSGSYREVARIEVPQSKAAIEAFAVQNRFVIEWRGAIPAETAQAG